MTAHKKLIAIDFDGVLHSYTSPWTDAVTISDPPTPGAMQFLKALVDDGRFEVVIVSSRLSDDTIVHVERYGREEGIDGYVAVYEWLRWELIKAFGDDEGPRLLDKITLSSVRPPAFLTIDDRAWTFQGDWPDLNDMASFKPWNKRWKVNKDASNVGFIVDTPTGLAFQPVMTLSEFEARNHLRSQLEAAWKAGTNCEYWENQDFQDRRMREDVERILAGDLAERVAS